MVKKHAPSLNSDQGFSLIELLVVIVILALLGSIVAVSYWKHIDKSKQQAAKTQIETLETALSSYRLDVGKFPTTSEGLISLRRDPGLKGWNGPYLDEKLPLDPWENKYQYTSPGDHGPFDLISYGADGLPGGEGINEDIVSWKNIGETDEVHY